MNGKPGTEKRAAEKPFLPFFESQHASERKLSAAVLLAVKSGLSCTIHSFVLGACWRCRVISRFPYSITQYDGHPEESGRADSRWNGGDGSRHS